ncbi:MAG: hypothetical protein DMF68_01160, partial [Acidobacteria bacterium]
IPYFLLSFLLLTAILFTQQAGQRTEILMGTHLPLQTIAQLSLLVLPNVLVFTLPMALLTGILIGFSRMGSDSEMVAMRAAGVGTWKMLWPPLLLGVLITIASLQINLSLAPEATRALRRVSSQAALYKLESPVEPRSFYTDIPHLVIYVRDGDKAQGLWGRVFLYKEERDGSTEIVTARTGRIDAAGEQSELVLSDVERVTMPGSAQATGQAYITERLDQLRVILDTGRKTVMEALRKEEAEPKPVEMSPTALVEYAAARTGTEARDAITQLHKRYAMALTPFVFAFLGTTIGLRVRKGGRGAGVLLSVLLMLLYYLLMLVGEQLSRAGNLSPLFGAWLASILSVTFGLILLFTRHRSLLQGVRSYWKTRDSRNITLPVRKLQRQTSTRSLGFPSLMDLDILRKAATSFTLVFISLALVFFVFTLFELWRYIISRGIRLIVVEEYFLFLLPLVTVQLLPASILVAMLVTYALISRHSEAIAWWAGGQSVYRLILPGLLFAALTALCLWFLQEQIMPEANIRQDDLRIQIRGGITRSATNSDRQWLASSQTNRLYSYSYDEKGSLKSPDIYEFDNEGVHLSRIIKGSYAYWTGSTQLQLEGVESLSFKSSSLEREEFSQTKLENAEQAEMFKPTIDRPSHLSAKALSDYIKRAELHGINISEAAVALQKKYAAPFDVLVMAIVGIPLAISFGRKSAIIALCFAVFLGLAFWAVSSGFQQLGDYELLPPLVAAWAPVAIFAIAGIYLLSRVRT